MGARPNWCFIGTNLGMATENKKHGTGLFEQICIKKKKQKKSR